jgi:phage pi2 protein 07
VIYKDVEYEGWVYYPHPETKLRHFQDSSLLEVIAYPIPEIKYGDEVQVLVDPQEIEVSRTS